MSGRIHLFLYKGVREQLEQIANEHKLAINDDTLGHLLQEGAKYVFKLHAGGHLTEEQLKELKEPREVTPRLERKVRAFLSNGTIRNLFKLEQEWGIDLFDASHGHILQTGFLWMFSALKTGAPKFLDEADIASLVKVYEPKVVYHR